MTGNSDDDNAREGRAARNLFRTDSDTESDDDGGDTQDDDNNNNDKSRVHRILNVELEEQTVGGSIEHRLWPAAEYLATFVVEQQQQQKESLPNLESDRSTINRPAVEAMEALQRLLQRTDVTRYPTTKGSTVTSNSNNIRILELGAGIGLTGIALAAHIPQARVVLTDLKSALPLLRSNVARNQLAISKRNSTVHVQTLAWGNDADMAAAMAFTTTTTATDVYHRNETDKVPAFPLTDSTPVLILGSDCIYWESLYQPLEATIATLLQACPPGSLCLLAGMRRWKRDNHFYQHVLGKSSRTSSGRLECVPIDERVTRIVGGHQREGVATAIDDTSGEQQQQRQRQVMRIYAVRWIQNVS